MNSNNYATSNQATSNNSSFIDSKSSFGNHWSSDSDNSSNRVNKLDERHIYMITDVQKLQTSFGKKYVLIDEVGSKYWTNNKIDEFIKAHKYIKRFQLITSEYKTFKNKKGDVIKYLSIDINY